MNNILIKILCGLFIVTTINSDAIASSQDTTILLANNNISTPASVKIIKVANIIYPESFEEHHHRQHGNDEDCERTTSPQGTDDFKTMSIHS